MSGPAWLGPQEAPCYPTARYELPEGYYFEVLPLVNARGRIVATDGVSVETFW